VVDAAITPVLDWVFTELGLLRVEIATTVENGRSQAVALRTGSGRRRFSASATSSAAGVSM